MSTDAPFLAAIAAAPLDRLPKLVYADWLEERGDPRGELIRIDVELLATPPADDRYWQLHARRGELMDGVPADWLTAVCLGNDAAPLLAHDWPDDVTGRWRTVRAAAERLLGRPLGDVGGHRDLVSANEDTLSLTLSPSLREWVAFVADAADPTSGTGFLIGFAPALRRTTSPNRLVLGRNSFEFRVLNGHLADDDPRVGEALGNQDMGQYGGVSELALFRLLGECHGTGGQLTTSLPLDEADDLRRRLAEVFPPPVQFGRGEVYEWPGLLVRFTPGSRTRTLVVASARAALPEAEVPAVVLTIGRADRQVSGLFVPEVLREPHDSRVTRLPPSRVFGDLPARLYQRGVEYRDGQNGREQNAAEAVRCFRLAADQGHRAAINSLGVSFDRGRGVPQDYAEALRLYQIAAEKGSALACRSVAELYESGKGVGNDTAEALNWFRKAADLGDEPAQKKLAALSHG